MRQSTWSNIFAIIGLIVIGSLLFSLVSGLLMFALKILIPVALVVWLVRYISGSHNRNNYYR
ncbi:hypothetical protein [Vagococcus acidifermentans]|uniref:Uncharacterized protein n=1 Tax=Vagococcus acidifermentans TaxID=564710 RepID=A0A430AT50_9ENTE|nr:hypothetical protein [Vagococcus acidifermentans]RSU11230.1 hypothetical protein CBF27_09030 [Vagococcus acidifermentans]